MASARGAGSGSAPNDDSDLEDLLAKSSTPTSDERSQAASIGTSGVISPLECCTGSFRLFCYSFPCLSKCIIILSVLGLLGFLSNTVFNTTAPMGIMGADYSAINSAFDLSLAKVDHWCIKGDNDSCKCEDPLEPAARSEFKSWNAAHKANVADVNLYRALFGSEPTKIDVATGKPRPRIDVAFVGESVVEAMDGRWLGKKVVRAINSNNDNGGEEGPEEKQKPDLGKTFERLFRKDKGGPVEGVALGIAGDNTANVLWRLQNDEMPYDFNPKVWWLVLGMNDLTRMQCSEEIVVLGILRVVEEIRLKKPDAHIVINSLLPMIEFQSLEEPKMADVVDFKTGGDNMKKNIEIEKAVKEYVSNGPPPMKGTDKTGRPGGRHLRSAPKKMTKKQKQWAEDHATEGPALEKAMARVKKSLEKTDKRIANKMFSDTEKYHPKKGVIPFLPMIKKSVLPPVWPAVHLINDKLREFCSKHESITFFDATPIFASDEGRGRHHLHNDLISPRGHPSDLGFAVWEGQIIGRLRKLILEKEKENEAKKAALPPPEEQTNDDDIHDDDEMGKEHVSDGKIAQPPPLPMKQPPRSDPPTEKDEGREHVSGGGKTAALPPEPMKQPPRASPTESKEEENEEEEDEEEKEHDNEGNVDVKKSGVVVKEETTVAEKKGNDDDDDGKSDPEKSAGESKEEKSAATKDEGDDDDEVNEKVEDDEKDPTAQKKTKAANDGDDDDNLHKEEEEEVKKEEDEEEDQVAHTNKVEKESNSSPQFRKSNTKEDD